ncbi:hypothetical protein [Quadrisphaera sp. DSM 44207]|uniref:hypothetical protein n=1 Tax=Quadrisphaera sp. DSM 44207 TaxID=1881057 RepID=UPI00115FC8A0|nr:hypothetical protein [Quadrisphaera sp. DSM 44207]
MTKVGARVELDAAVLRSVDEVAEQLGTSRDQVIEDSIRRSLATRLLTDVLAAVRANSDLSEEQASELARDEVKAVRAARKARGRAVLRDDGLAP